MSGAPGWLKLSVGSASRVAPGAVARLAHALYRSPAVARRFDRGSKALLREAEAILAEGAFTDVLTATGRLRVHRFSARGASRRKAPTVLLLHAWTTDARAMAAFVEPLREAGFDVAVPDLPAHGASAGRRTDAPQAARILAGALGETGIFPRHVIGHSFGGGVAGLLTKHGIVPERFVCIASPSRLSAVTTDFSVAFGLSRRCRLAFEGMVEASGGMPIDALDGLKIWPSLPTRILLLHAPDDAEIAFDEAERLATMPNAALVPMPGRGHREIVYHEDSVRLALEFLTMDEKDIV
ncbi:MAG: alpha/beta fold hydrolase [Pseudomonadota bacterium]